MKFAAIGLDHNHIYGQVSELIAAGGHLAGFATTDDTQADQFSATHPDVPRRSEDALLADPEIMLITSAAIPADRAALSVRAMQAGKDVLLDKPGVLNNTDLHALKTTYAETGRRVRVHHSELESNAAAQTALRLVREGAIGRVIHYFGAGPHRLDQGVARPDWFWDRSRNGGILVDIGTHQIAQFLAFTGQERCHVSAARVAEQGAAPGFQDMGDMLLETEGAQGYGRVDWYTPKGLPVWGDGRTLLTGTAGTIELRKYVDPAGDGPGAHLVLTNAEGPRRIPCTDRSDFCKRILADAVDGSETAMAQETAFHIMEMAVAAQMMAERSEA